MANSRTGTHIQSITLVMYHNILCLSIYQINILYLWRGVWLYVEIYDRFDTIPSMIKMKMR